MSWERRRNRWYYTRSKRVNGRIVRTYFGRGPEAEAAAAEDEQRRQRRLENKQKWAQRAELEAQIDEYDELVMLVVRVEMAVKGYHYTRGEWRKHRNFEKRMAAYEARLQLEREVAAARAAAAVAPAPQRRPVPTPAPRPHGPGMVRDFWGRVIRPLQQGSNPAVHDRSTSAGAAPAKRSSLPDYILGPIRVIGIKQPKQQPQPRAAKRTKQGKGARPPPVDGMRVP